MAWGGQDGAERANRIVVVEATLPYRKQMAGVMVSDQPQASQPPGLIPLRALHQPQELLPVLPLQAHRRVVGAQNSSYLTR